MSMGTNGKFFKKITSLRKLKKEAKRTIKEFFEVDGLRVEKEWFKISKWTLRIYGEGRKNANREYSGKINDND